MAWSSSADDGLLDIVPWRYGFAHTWVLKWLIGSERHADILWDSIEWDRSPHRRPRDVEPLDGPCVEYPLPGRRRADLWVRLREHRFVFETKVDDALSIAQLSAYQSLRPEVPVLHAPGVTGLLWAHHDVDPIARVNVTMLATGMSEAPLPHTLRTYVDVLLGQVRLHGQLRSGIRAGATDPGLASEPNARRIADAIWLSEIDALITAPGGTCGGQLTELRATQNDQGVTWKDSVRRVRGGADVYIDVLVPRSTSRRLISIKAGGAGRSELFSMAKENPPGARWTSARRGRSKTTSLWTFDAAGCDLEACEHALREAYAWIHALPG